MLARWLCWLFFVCNVSLSVRPHRKTQIAEEETKDEKATSRSIQTTGDTSSSVKAEGYQNEHESSQNIQSIAASSTAQGHQELQRKMSSGAEEETKDEKESSRSIQSIADMTSSSKAAGYQKEHESSQNIQSIADTTSSYTAQGYQKSAPVTSSLPFYRLTYNTLKRIEWHMLQMNDIDMFEGVDARQALRLRYEILEAVGFRCVLSYISPPLLAFSSFDEFDFERLQSALRDPLLEKAVSNAMEAPGDDGFLSQITMGVHWHLVKVKAHRPRDMLDIFRRLVKAGADVNARAWSNGGLSALQDMFKQRAHSDEWIEIIKVVLENGAAQLVNNLPFSEAAILVEDGPEGLGNFLDAYRATPLCYAFRLRDEAVVRLLARYGASRTWIPECVLELENQGLAREGVTLESLLAAFADGEAGRVAEQMYALKVLLESGKIPPIKPVHKSIDFWKYL